MIFDRFRRQRPVPLREPFTEVREAPQVPMTASESVDRASAIISSLDPQAYPVMLSTAGIDDSGYSATWEVNFASVTMVASLWVEFSPEGTTLRGRPHLNHSPGSFMPKLWGTLNPAQRRIYLDEWFKHPPLGHFIDSPDVVRSLLAEHSIDLTAGSTNVSLATDRTKEVWRLSVGRDQWESPLRAR